MQLARWLLGLGIGFWLASVALAEEPVVERGVSYLRDSGERWKNQRGCVSCHQIPAMVWAFESAKRLNVDVQEQELAQWREWSVDVVNFAAPKNQVDLDVEATMAGNIDTMTALLLAIPQAAEESWREPFVRKLVSEQQADGSWLACGQLPLQRRPEHETHATTTLWTVLSLLEAEADFDLDKATAFADSVDESQSIEWLAARLLVAHRLDDPKQEALVNRMLELQNDDGGWGWKVGEPSDALGTGYALYALAYVGAARETLESAKKFLADTQLASGAWEVPGTKGTANGRSTATARDWGTAWALIAWCEAEMRLRGE